MNRFFLKAKHWQLFLLTFGVLIAYQLFLFFTVVTNLGPEGEPATSSLIGPFKIYPIIILIYLAVFFGWMWNVTNTHQGKIKAEIRKDLKWFNRLIYVPIIFFMTIMLYMTYLINQMLNSDTLPDYSFVVPLVILQFIAVIFSFYCIYVAARNFKLAETQRDVTIGDFIGEFVLIWFFPIGIWFLQPKVNDLIEDEIV